MKYLYIFSFYFAIAFSFNNLVYSQNFKLELDEAYVISENSGNSDAYIFSGVRTILPHPDGNLFVADASNASIRVFNKEGKFIRKIGQRGRGPGDFHEVTFIDSFKDGSFIVADRMQERIFFYDSEGNFLKSESLDGKSLGTLQFVYKLNEEDYLLGFRDYMNAEENGYFFHQYGESLNTEKGHYLDLYKHLFDIKSPFERRFSISPRYLSTRFGDNQIALSSYLYTGTSAVLNIKTFETTIFGDLIADPYIIYDWEERIKLRESGEPGYASVSGQTGKFFFKTKRANFGLVGNSKFLLQFYMIFEGKEMIPFLKIYSSSGEELANISLEDSSVDFDMNNTMSFKPHYLDENYNLYAFDNNYEGLFPAVRIFKTNLHELISN